MDSEKAMDSEMAIEIDSLFQKDLLIATQFHSQWLQQFAIQ
jgi:hypothetical protein